MRLTTAGESHGPGVVAILEGLPAGAPVRRERVEHELRRRRHGYGRGPRMAIETDEVEILAGAMGGVAIGSPVAVLVRNAEWARWRDAVYDREGERGDSSLFPTVPRPGHADYAGCLKYGFDNLRPVIERSSARSTAALVAAGAICKETLEAFGVSIGSVVVGVGAARAPVGRMDPDALARCEANDFRAPDDASAERFRGEVDRANERGTTVGGVVEVWVFGLPPGIGGYGTADERLDGALAKWLMSIPSVRAVEIGDGVDVAGKLGYEAVDEFEVAEGRVRRTSNLAGGMEGGTTNGEPVRVRLYAKPIPTQRQPLRSFDLRTGVEERSFYERSDVCAVPAIGVIGEACAAFAVLDHMRRKFGGDSLGDMREAFEAYLRRIDWRP